MSPNNNKDDDVEKRMLASMDASLREQDDYEDHVLRQATQQLAPLLEEVPGLVSFPPLHSLAPSYSTGGGGGGGGGGGYNPSDLPHFHSVLSKTRKAIFAAEQTKTNNSNSNSNTTVLNRLYLKEQMILSFLSTVARVSPEELPVKSLPEERAAEERRSQAIINIQQAEATASVVQPLPSPAPVLHTRVPMMKRKRDERNQEEPDEDLGVQHKEQLRKLRLERKRQREQRRRAWFGNDSDDDDDDDDASSSSSSSSSEEEAEMEFENDEAKQHDDDDADDADDEPAQQQRQQVQTDLSGTTTTCCPLCHDVVSALEPSQLDAVLSAHMDQCQRRRPSRRSTASQSNNNNSSSSTSTSTSSTMQQRIPQTKLEKKKKKTSNNNKKKKKSAAKQQHHHHQPLDDLVESNYEDRVDDWIDHGLPRMKVMRERDTAELAPGACYIANELYLPAWINDSLFGYQRSSLEWMWGLHQQQAGGVLGDEMGLGKTVQVAAYLGVLAASRKLKGVLVVAPATMLQHWLKELSVWAPGLRRILIHQSGEADGTSRSISTALLQSLAKWLRLARADCLYEAIDDDDRATMPPHSFCGTGYVVITTYENVRRNSDVYSAHEWSYAVLDEAQKIRNPDADVTLACKRLRTPHRIAMSGTPIQNDLKELWSLFDFVFPGRLGTLPAFEQEFAEPIRRGGYSNASPMQVQLAYRCALMLKDLIEPYLLRRQKKDVKEVARMPGKTEHVLFCRLSTRQRTMYEAYLESDDVKRVVRGSGQLLAAVTMLRKICNHPDLVCDPDQASLNSFVRNGYVNPAGTDNSDLSDVDDDEVGLRNEEETLMERSGKLEVLSKILPLWHEQRHRVLIFCQWRKMLNIIQRFMVLKGWKFGRLDGNTVVSARQKKVDEFNSDVSYFAMLCTTRTGGVGLNLTGANRIILYDPDFNPQTDAQARERAWRFGQEREVTVYRLITAGTVEEKIYQRQIFKTALSNSVLQDPRQRRLFSQRDLRNLFTLQADTGSVRSGGDGMTETAQATKGVGVVGPDEEVAEETSKDNEETMRKVMRSKGLAGIFDHDFVEQDPTRRKSATIREMEDQAKLVAREAVTALRQSVAAQHQMEPESRFGSSKSAAVVGSNNGGRGRSQSLPMNGTGSGSLLASLRQRNAAVESAGANAPASDEAKHYANLLARITDYVRRKSPTTDELLREFDDMPTSDVAIFRRLLKSVASMESGKWRLIRT